MVRPRLGQSGLEHTLAQVVLELTLDQVQPVPRQVLLLRVRLRLRGRPATCSEEHVIGRRLTRGFKLRVDNVAGNGPSRCCTEHVIGCQDTRVSVKRARDASTCIRRHQAIWRKNRPRPRESETLPRVSGGTRLSPWPPWVSVNKLFPIRAHPKVFLVLSQNLIADLEMFSSSGTSNGSAEAGGQNENKHTDLPKQRMGNNEHTFCCTEHGWNCNARKCRDTWKMAQRSRARETDLAFSSRSEEKFCFASKATKQKGRLMRHNKIWWA
jgi:hypothetical protein